MVHPWCPGVEAARHPSRGRHRDPTTEGPPMNRGLIGTIIGILVIIILVIVILQLT